MVNRIWISLLSVMVLLGLSVPASAFPQQQVTLQDWHRDKMDVEIALMLTALQTRDVDTIVEFTHPAIFELVDGEANFRKRILPKVLHRLNTLTILRFRHDIPRDCPVLPNKVMCIVPAHMVLEYKGKTLRNKSFLIAISNSGGAQWKFLDGSSYAKNRSIVESMFPELPNSLVFPKTSNTVCKTDQECQL